MTNVSDMQAVFDRVEAVLVGMEQPAPVVPDGYVMVPMRLTAENGAKGALSGEFSETKLVNCPECFGDDECETCDGSGKIEITVPVTRRLSKLFGLKVSSILQPQRRRMINVNHLMIDTETMGNKPNAPVVSIGAVFFEPSTGELGEEFYRVVSLKSSMDGGAVPDPETIIWWMQQNEEARKAICDKDAISISAALIKLNTFILDNTDIDKVQVWGNGATFDNVILRANYEREFLPCIWKFWNDRDVRTIVELGRAIGINPRRDIPFEGDRHNALADAKHRAKYVSAIWQRLVHK